MENMDNDNKYIYWVFTIQAIKGSTLPGEQTMVQAISRLTDKYVFQLEEATSLHYQGCCKTRIRKRHKTFLNELIAELDIPKACVTLAPMQGTWDQAREYCTKTATSISEPFTNEVLYKGKDIEILDRAETRFPWQNSLINKIIDFDTLRVKDADDRTIIWIRDTKGSTGKSKLVKWFCSRYNNMVKISFGTSSQLRSAIIAAGQRQVYFVDVPRTLGSDDSMASLMSALEDLKNGFVVSSMYGQNQSILLDPPHIIVFSNQECPYKMMSLDRWEIYGITHNKELYNVDGDLSTWMHEL